MTAATLNTATSSSRVGRPTGVDGAIYRAGIRLVAWSRARSAKRALELEHAVIERQWRDAIVSYGEATRTADVYRSFTIR